MSVSPVAQETRYFSAELEDKCGSSEVLPRLTFRKTTADDYSSNLAVIEPNDISRYN